jgi:hypothetical protein
MLSNILNIAFDVRMEYSRKTFGKQFIDYLGSKNFNLKLINIKRKIFHTEGNHITIEIKKKKIRFGYF